MNKITHGQSQDHLIILNEDNVSIHKDMVQDFNKLKALAKEDDIDLCIISGFRSFEKQKAIWNKKVPINYTEDDILKSLRWSAIPGFSRHHWGTDLDVADKNALKLNPEYKILLEPHEYDKKGIFSKLGQWLGSHLQSSMFFRPYSKDLDGVAIEPWHISHTPLSSLYMSTLNLESSLDFLSSQSCHDIHGVKYLKENFEKLFNQYIINISERQ